MHGAYLKDIARTIRANLKRFISIALICMLGVAMFCGLHAACEDLRATADAYFDEQQLFDIQVLSTLGLTDDDIEALAEVEGVVTVSGGWAETTYVAVDDELASVEVYAFASSSINVPYLLEGRLPSAAGEVAVTEAFLEDSGLELGDSVELEDPASEDDQIFERESYTIVGVVIDAMDVNNPLLSFRSTSGTDYTFTVSEEAVTSEVYTVAYIQVEGAQALACYSEEYEECVTAVVNRIDETVRATQEEARTTAVISEAQEELDDAWASYLEERSNAELELADAQAQLDDAAQQIADGQASIASALAELQESEQSLVSAQQEITDSWEMYASLGASAEELSEALAQIDTTLVQIEALLQVETDPQQRDVLLQQQTELLATRATLAAQQEQLTLVLTDLAAQLTSFQAEIDAAWPQITDGYAQINTSIAEIESAIASYEEGLAAWEASYLEAEEQFSEAEAELEEAQNEIDAIETATWYIQTRQSLASYSAIESDADSIEAIGTIFPVVFLVVAALVALTTITRMVEEERAIIGLYKALGYRAREIYLKYVVFALAACTVGSLLGIVLGYVGLPLFLFTIFSIMYVLPSYLLLYDPWYAWLGVLIFLVAIVGTALVACWSEVQQTPAALMRPKAPKAGSRILLEHIRPIWRRLSFLNKVTARNLFRYKQRFLMTIGGILGCTALIVCGFIIRDSAAQLVSEQYDLVSNYDIMAVAQDGDIEELAEQLTEDERVAALEVVRIDSITLVTDAGEENLTLLVVPEGASLDGYIHLADVDTEEDIELPDSGIVVTRNAAEVLDFEVGAEVTLRDSTLNSVEVEVVSIVRNYLGNFVFMSEAAFEEAFDEDYESNGFLLNVVDTSEDDATNESAPIAIDAYAEELGNELAQDSRLLSVTVSGELSDGYENSLAIINGIVVVLIAMAAALAFAVLFALSTTNISERERELATIKVLGFRSKEVHIYLNKETLILTVIGIAIGLPCGWVLGDIVLRTLKMPQISFLTTIEPISWVISAVLPALFALAVSLITNRMLDRIDMIGALKSVE